MRGEGAPCADAGPSLVIASVEDSMSSVGQHQHHNGSVKTEIKEEGGSKSDTGQSPTSDDTKRGRLKFFKDGKFILELSWERETESWHQVAGSGLSGASRGSRTVWIPTASAAGSARSTASVSGASDNTSTDDPGQLSPLAGGPGMIIGTATTPTQQREDHCWKQLAPRRRDGAFLSGLSLGSSLNSIMTGGPLTGFIMVRPPAVAAILRRKWQRNARLRRLRRRPFDPLSPDDALLFHSPDGSPGQVNGHTRGAKKRIKLSTIVLRLRDAAMLSGPVFSPRKRILRELERVSLVSDAAEPAKKQQRAPSQTQASPSSAPPPKPPSTSSPYSITSLLSHDHPSPSAPPPPFAVYYPPPFYHPHPLWPYPHAPLVGRPYPGVGPPPQGYSPPGAFGGGGLLMSSPATNSDLPLNLSKNGGG